MRSDHNIPGDHPAGEIFQADDPDRTAGHIFANPVNRTSLNGVTGFPSRASLEDGRRLFDWMVEDLCEMVERGKRVTPPLDIAYDARVEAGP